MQNDILDKLLDKIARESQDRLLNKVAKELGNRITTEAQAVYILVQIRKLLEDSGTKKFEVLKMFCDWALHTELSRNKQIVALLAEFDEAIERANSGYGPMRHDYLSLKK